MNKCNAPSYNQVNETSKINSPSFNGQMNQYICERKKSFREQNSRAKIANRPMILVRKFQRQKFV